MVKEFMEKVIQKNPGEVEFHQAVREVVESLEVYLTNPSEVPNHMFPSLSANIAFG